MASAYQQTLILKEVLGFSEEDQALIQASIPSLTANIGNLMALLAAKFFQSPEVEETLFDDDADLLQSFGSGFSEFIMKVTSAGFSEAYCDEVSSLWKGLSQKPPAAAYIGALGLTQEWISTTLYESLCAEPEQYQQTLKAWQKLATLNLQLLLSSYT